MISEVYVSELKEAQEEAKRVEEKRQKDLEEWQRLVKKGLKKDPTTKKGPNCALDAGSIPPGRLKARAEEMYLAKFDITLS